MKLNYLYSSTIISGTSLRQKMRKLLVLSASVLALHLSSSVAMEPIDNDNNSDDEVKKRVSANRIGVNIVTPCIYPKKRSEHESHGISDRTTLEDLELDPEQKETVLKRLHLGLDGRKEVMDTRIFPYSAQAYFIATFPGSEPNKVEIGSGTFIRPHIILTGGHVVYSHKKGGYYKSLLCKPAANKGYLPFDEPNVIGVKILQSYDKIKKRENDYALVFIDKPIGLETGCIGIAVWDDPIKLIKFTKKNPVNVAGYPGDKLKKVSLPKQFQMSGPIEQISKEGLEHLIDTAPGQSGSSIWYKDPDTEEYFSVGVHAYGGETNDLNSFNYGPYLTAERAKLIKESIDEFEEKQLKGEHFEYSHPPLEKTAELFPQPIDPKAEIVLPKPEEPSGKKEKEEGEGVRPKPITTAPKKELTKYEKAYNNTERTYRDEHIEIIIRGTNVVIDPRTGQTIILDPQTKIITNKNFKDHIQSIMPVKDQARIPTRSLAIWPLRFDDLSPVESLIHLLRLSISNSQLSTMPDISFIENLKLLVDLSLANMNLDNIDVLSHLVELHRLNLTGNEVVDISPLESLNKLKELRLPNNKIKDITPLVNLSNLEILNLAENSLNKGDANLLGRLTELRQLILTGIKEEPNEFCNLKKLTTLSMKKGEIQELEWLSELRNLTNLDLEHNIIINIESLSSLAELSKLNLGHNKIEMPNAMLSLQKLSDLEIRNNDISKTRVEQFKQAYKKNFPSNNVSMKFDEQ